MTQDPESYKKSSQLTVLAQPGILLVIAAPLVTKELLLPKNSTPGLSAVPCSNALPSNRDKQKFKKYYYDEQQNSPTLDSPTRRLYWPDKLLPQYQVLKDPSRFCSVGTEPVQSLSWPPPAPLSKQRIFEAPGRHGHHTWQEEVWAAKGCSPGTRSHNRSPPDWSKNSKQVHPMGYLPRDLSHVLIFSLHGVNVQICESETASLYSCPILSRVPLSLLFSLNLLAGVLHANQTALGVYLASHCLSVHSDFSYPMQHLWLIAGWLTCQIHKVWGLGKISIQHTCGVRNHCLWKAVLLDFIPLLPLDLKRKQAGILDSNL